MLKFNFLCSLSRLKVRVLLLVKLTAGKGKQHQDVEEAELTDVEDHSAQYHLEQRTLLERRKINKILIRRCTLVISTSGKYKLISLLNLFEN